MKKYEYDVVKYVDVKYLKDILDEWSAKGWRYVDMVRENGQIDYNVVFEREIEE